jgi:O-antigen/teichoic acid export membrane protein
VTAGWPELRRRIAARDLGPLIRDTMRYSWSKVIPGLAGLVFVMVFARLLGDAGYGRYALAVSVATWAAAFSGGWLNQAVLRYYGDSWWHGSETRRAIILGLGLSIGLGSVGICLFTAFRPAESGSFVRNAGPVVLLYGALTVYQLRVSLLQAQLRTGTVLLVGVAQAVFSVVIPLILLALLPGSAAVVISAVALSYGIASVFALPRRTRPDAVERTGDSLNPTPLNSLFNYGWGLSLWFALVTAMPLTDRFLIERFNGVAATGQYAALYDLIMRSFSLLTAPMALAAHPRIMRYWTAGRYGAARTTWKWAMAAQFAVFLGMLLVITVAGNWLVSLVLPNSTAIQSALIPLLFAGFAWQFALLGHKPLEVDALTPWMVVAAAAAVVVSVGGNIWLLPRYGPIAAAYTYGAAAVAYLVVTFIVAFAFRARLAVPEADGGAQTP